MRPSVLPKSPDISYRQFAPEWASLRTAVGRFLLFAATGGRIGKTEWSRLPDRLAPALRREVAPFPRVQSLIGRVWSK